MDTKPTRKGAIIKPGHPHSDGLQAAYMFNDSGDTVYDWTKNNNTLDIVGADIVDEGLKCDADGEYSSLDNSNQLISSTKGTVILYFKSLSAITDEVRRILFGKYGLSSSLGEFAIMKNSDNLFYFFLNDGSSHYAYYNNSILPNWQTGTQITIMWDRTASVWGSYKAVVNVDGVNKTPTGYSGITASPPWSAYTIDDPLYIGNDADGGTNESNGITSRCYIYNTVTSVDIIQSVFEKPYDMWIYPTIPEGIKIDYADGPFDKT